MASMDFFRKKALPNTYMRKRLVKIKLNKNDKAEATRM
jgi:hypothetical protein